METQEYKTKDLGEGSALIERGVRLLRLDRYPNYIMFVFEDSKKTANVSHMYYFGNLMVIAKRYNEAMQTLKDRVFTLMDTDP